MARSKQSAVQNDEIRAVVGRNVRRFRLAQKMTQAELAARLDVDRSYVVDLETGNRNPTLTALDDLAFLLGVFVVDLLRLDTMVSEDARIHDDPVSTTVSVD